MKKIRLAIILVFLMIVSIIFIFGRGTAARMSVEECGCYNGSYSYRCGDVVYDSCTLNCDLRTSGTCFTLGNDNVVIDGNGHTIYFYVSEDSFTSSEAPLFIIKNRGYDHITIKNLNIEKLGPELNSFSIFFKGSEESVIENNNFEGGRVGVLLVDSSNFIIRNNEFSRLSYGEATSWATCNPLNTTEPYRYFETGIWLVYSNSGTVYNNSVYGNETQSGGPNHQGTESGITLCGSNYTNLTDNTIKYVDTFGFYLSKSHYNDVFYNFINGSNISGASNTNDGIILGGASGDVNYGSSTNNNISYNEFHQCSEWGIFLTASSTDNMIYHNTIEDSAQVGIRIASGSHGAIVKKNMVEDSGSYGIAIESSDNCTISENVIDNAGTSGIILSITSNSYISNNLIENGQRGIWLNGAFDNTLVNNEIKNSRSHGVDIDYATGNIFIDSSIINSATKDIYSDVISSNNTFLNVSFNKSHVQIDNGVIYVKWYLDALVQRRNGASVNGATVKAYDKNNVLVFTENTGRDGMIPRKNLMEYQQTSSGREYFIPYYLKAFKGSQSSRTELVNLTTNMIGEDRIVLTISPFLVATQEK